MNHDRPRADAGAALLQEGARLLSTMADAMGEQSEFFADDGVAFSVHDVRAAAELAARRASAAASAGPARLREMERTVFIELARAALGADAVLARAGGEAWPTLSDAVSAALELVRASLEADPAIVGWSPSPSDADAATAAGHDGWRTLPSGTRLLEVDGGIALLAEPLGDRRDARWVARVGLLPVAVRPTAEAACEAAAGAYTRLRGPVPDTASVPVPA